MLTSYGLKRSELQAQWHRRRQCLQSPAAREKRLAERRKSRGPSPRRRRRRRRKAELPLPRAALQQQEVQRLQQYQQAAGAPDEVGVCDCAVVGLRIVFRFLLITPGAVPVAAAAGPCAAIVAAAAPRLTVCDSERDSLSRDGWQTHISRQLLPLLYAAPRPTEQLAPHAAPSHSHRIAEYHPGCLQVGQGIVAFSANHYLL